MGSGKLSALVSRNTVNFWGPFYLALGYCLKAEDPEESLMCIPARLAVMAWVVPPVLLESLPHLGGNFQSNLLFMTIYISKDTHSFHMNHMTLRTHPGAMALISFFLARTWLETFQWSTRKERLMSPLRTKWTRILLISAFKFPQILFF